MPEHKDKEVHSFADAHLDWVDKHSKSRWQRLRQSFLFPPRDASPLRRTLGFLWRAFAVAALALILIEALAHRQLRSQHFADIIARELHLLLAADDAHCTPLHWKKRLAAIDRLEATGSTDSFFHSLKAEGVRFRLPWHMTFQKDWRLETISIQNLDLALNREFPPLPPAPAPRTPASAGFGLTIHPRLQQLEFDSLNAANATLRWGADASSTGALENARLTISPTGQEWRFTASSGRLRQGAFKNLNITKLEFRHQPGAIHIDECHFTLGQSGKGSLQGKISTGPVPRINLQTQLHAVSLADLLADPFSQYASGTVDASMKISGSTTTREGVVFDADLKLHNGLLHDIPALETLTSLYADPRFRRLKITSGHLHLNLAQGKLTVDQLDLASGDFARLTGSFNTAAVEQSNSPEFSGALSLGVHPSAIAKYPELLPTWFPRETEGLRWIAINLNGPVKQITRETSASLAADARTLQLQKSRAKP